MSNPEAKTQFSTTLNNLNNKLEEWNKQNQKSFIELNQKIENALITKIQLIERDLTWIKWLFGLFFALISVLLSTILTVLFKLID